MKYSPEEGVPEDCLDPVADSISGLLIGGISLSEAGNDRYCNC